MKENEVQTLKQKIKLLEIEICERTRNFLAQRTTVNQTKSLANRQSQTEPQSHPLHFQITPNKLTNSIIENLGNQSSCQGPSASQRRPQYFEITDLSESRHEELIHRKTFPPAQFNFQDILPHQNQEKQRLNQLALDLEEEHRRYVEENRSVTDSTFSEQTRQFSQEKEDREKRKLKRQNKKLKTQIQYQIKINTYAKEGLMISEEENYRFRLRIKELLTQLEKQKAIEVELNEKLAKSQINARQMIASASYAKQLLEQLTLMKQLKEEYSNENIKLQTENQQLRDENLRLRSYVNLMESSGSVKASKEQMFEDVLEPAENLEIHQQFIEILKEKVFAISNLIPLSEDSEITEDLHIFRPQNQTEILQSLTRIQAFCEQIQEWEKRNNRALKQEKQYFVTFLQTIVSHGTITKQTLIDQMEKNEEMKFYCNTIFQLSKKNSTSEILNAKKSSSEIIESEEAEAG